MTQNISPETQGETNKASSVAPQASPTEEDLTAEEALRSFLELQEELSDIDSAGQYVAVMRQLVRIKDALGPSPARTKVRTAMRNLQERLPQIREKDHQSRTIKLNTRIAEVERQSPRCPRGHSMVIRRGPNASLFWGCSEFPLCYHTKRLTAEQRSRIGS